MIVKIVIIAIICIFLSGSIRKYNSEFAAIISVAGGVIIFLLCLDELNKIVDYFFELYKLTDLNIDFLSVVLKIIGVGYITEFTADIAEDFGDKSLASKVILGGKVVICGMTLPIIKKLLIVLLSFLS